MKKMFYLSLMVFILTGCGTTKKNVLIIGDSISLGYTPYVKQALAEKADVFHNYGNARSTQRGVDSISVWIDSKKWDIIHFNFGLHDLCHRNESWKKDKVNGKYQVSPDKYAENLETIIKVLKNTKAKLIFATTTMVPSEEPGRKTEDVEVYNDIALKIMKKHGIKVNDLYRQSLTIHPEFGKGINNVHYTDKGYEKLSGFVAETVREEM